MHRLRASAPRRADDRRSKPQRPGSAAAWLDTSDRRDAPALLAELEQERAQVVEALPLLGHDLGRRLLRETGVRQFLFAAHDILLEFFDFLRKARELGVLVDEARHRYQHHHLAHQRDRRFGRGLIDLEQCDGFQGRQKTAVASRRFHAASIFRAPVLQQHGQRLARRDIHLAAYLAHAEGEFHHPLHLLGRRCIEQCFIEAGIRLQQTRRTRPSGQRRDTLPYLFGDEGHERMSEAQYGLERLDQCPPRTAPRRGTAVRIVEHGFAEFEVPVAELVPGEFINRLRHEIETIPLAVLAHLPRDALQTRAYPAIGEAEFEVAFAAIVSFGVHQYVTRGVPELVAEVAIALDAAEVDLDVAARGRERGKGIAKRIGAEGGAAYGKILARGLLDLFCHLGLHEAARAFLDERFEIYAVDEVDWIEHVALRLRHFLTMRIAHQTVNIDLAERYLARELEAHHDHACDPEEDDVEAGHEHAGRIKGLELRRLSRPTQRRERPQRRAEPGVEHVVVLPESHDVAKNISRSPPSRNNTQKPSPMRRGARGGGGPAGAGAGGAGRRGGAAAREGGAA